MRSPAPAEKRNKARAKGAEKRKRTLAKFGATVTVH